MSAQRLRALHIPGDPLVLPNAWDADSARLVVEAGFPVVATSSAAVAASLGYSDGEQVSPDEMFDVAARITAAVDVPLTVDVESGYGLSALELADRLAEADAAGCNIEDTDQQEGRRRSADENAALLASVKEHSGELLVVNARIDSFLGAQGAEEERAALPDAIERARAYLDAGADCVYPIHVRSPEVLGEFVSAVSPALVNATYLPDGPDLAMLTKLGVARVSLGTGLWRLAQARISSALSALAGGASPF
ncbi:isocitrate lyase/PEP mutase family protein [Haloechinothrix halophila]|uniref:isocitrate lyase/PEP mutase family protein n=1 Tax=Haloechinothrix halophila TaxID=1069073 RepID=UPI00041A571B|nr:isocitrate lyase/phosphoenolpyruvate mutase family protein [Haloechinothrix halophila]